MNAPAQFEHIALAVHLDDLLAWDRVLRSDLGGTRGLGGGERRMGFQGGQVDYPDGGMLELITWMEGSGKKSPNERYVERHGGRAALHHVTFLVDDFDASLELARAIGEEPMVGRVVPNWKEYFVRAPELLPKGLLIQVLKAAKRAQRESGLTERWEPFLQTHAEALPPSRIRGVHFSSGEPDAAARRFETLLGAERETSADGLIELRWPGSSMSVRIAPGDDPSQSFIRVDTSAGERLSENLAASDRPERAAELLRVEPDPA